MHHRNISTRIATIIACVCLWAGAGWAQPDTDVPRPTPKPAKRTATTKPTTRATTKPTTRPKSPKSLTADEMMSRLLKPPAAGESTAARPLPPVPDGPAEDKTSGEGAVAPSAPSVRVLPEGTFLVDRLGRVSRGGKDGTEFVFESDGSALQDPPVVLLPSLKTMQMEEIAAGSDRDKRFRVTGMVTEYRGRNYLLLEKVLVVPEASEQF